MSDMEIKLFIVGGFLGFFFLIVILSFGDSRKGD